ncbi:MAG: nucleic acid-binding protein [Methanoregula sp.]|uniref:nucleic acid-binding protein n=1 Tax=Methanoregula sp. TaxID=2052170 RepID=UPI003BB1DD33
MVLFHYALVDDLIPQEEFERRVEQKIEECGDLLDEPTAAMLVVGALGRQHVRVRELSGKSSLFCFFAKVVDKTEPKEFVRKDGEKGWVATLLVGDETGTTRIVLWDEKAGAVLEIAIGDVLEIIGRHPGKNMREIYALALRKATCEITCTVPAGNGTGLSAEPVDLDVLLIGAGAPRTFTRRDGTTGEMQKCVIGDATGTARLVVWAPDLLLGIPAGSALHIAGAKPDRRSEGRAYSLDESGTVSLSDAVVTVPFAPLASVSDNGYYSVHGEVKTVHEPRSFTSRDGTTSWVRNIRIGEGDEVLSVVLWGEHALVPVHPGDRIEIYHAAAKPGRFGGIELGVGRGSIFRVPHEETRAITFTGTIIPGNGCTFIDNGTERYLIEREFPAGCDVKITGVLSGSRIIPERSEPAERSPDAVAERLAALAARLDAPLPP